MKYAIVILLIASAYTINAQQHFSFVTGKVIDHTDFIPDIGHPEWEVWASSDSLYIGIPQRPILLKGISWINADDGTMYFLNKYIHLQYIPPKANEESYLLFAAPNLVMELYPKSAEY